MVKKKVGGGKRYQAALKAQQSGKAGDGAGAGAKPAVPEGPAPPAHLQRKISRKVKFMDKLQASRQLGAGIQKKSKKKRALPDLSTLGAALDEVAAAGQLPGGVRRKGAGGKGGGVAEGQRQRGASVKTSKARQQIMQEECTRLSHVLKHPLYKQDPIAAITNHLTSTLGEAAAATAAAVQQKQRQQQQAAKGKGGGKGKGKGRGGGGGGAMEQD